MLAAPCLRGALPHPGRRYRIIYALDDGRLLVVVVRLEIHRNL